MECREFKSKTTMKQKEQGTDRQEMKVRIFANPQTGDDAEADLPSMEFLANGFNTGEHMTKEEILKNGTTLQKLRLYISSIDLSGYFEAKEQLTDEEEKLIISSIRTDKDREISDLCIKEYNSIFEFGTRLSFFFKRFQTSFALLSRLLNKLDSYEYTAKQLTKLFNAMENSVIEKWKDAHGNVKFDPTWIYPDYLHSSFLLDLLYSDVLEGVTLKFDLEKKYFFIDTEGENGLYSQILHEAESTTKALSDFKAYAVVAEDYINKSTLKFMPIPIQLSIDNAIKEMYTRCLVKNLRYFRSELNQRIARGETVTPEEEKMAFIPDYYEVKPSKNVLEDCKVLIKKISDGR